MKGFIMEILVEFKHVKRNGSWKIQLSRGSLERMGQIFISRERVEMVIRHLIKKGKLIPRGDSFNMGTV